MSAPTASTEAPARAMRLLVQSLPDADLLKIEAFLRIGGGRLRHPWSLVNEGAADVLLIGEEEPQTIAGLLDDPTLTLRVVDAGSADAPRLLVRPMQYEDLLSRLAAFEASIATRVSSAPRTLAGGPDAAAGDGPASSTARAAGTTSGAASAGQSAAARAPAGISAASPGARAAPSATSVDTRSAGAAVGFQADARFRLLRWPPAALLHGHRYHTRLASFLSVRHLPADELARLGNVEPEVCLSFVRLLHDAGLLDVKTTGTAAPGPAAPQATTERTRPMPAATIAAKPTSAGQGPSAPAGLFDRLRQTLGLRRSR